MRLHTTKTSIEKFEKSTSTSFYVKKIQNHNTITITIMLHVDNSVSVSCRHIIRLYNILQERILIPSEIQFLSSTFQTLLQNRIGTVNEITIKNVTINSQSYIYGEDVPQIDIVITIYGRYIPPPEIHFCKDLLMNEFDYDGYENLWFRLF